MLYGIFYLFKLSDFLAVARKHGASWLCLSSCWLKQDSISGGAGEFAWTDVHELAFMGAFGMAYKMQVDGELHVGKVADNNALARRAKVILTEVHSKWRDEHQGRKRDLLVVPGILMQSELVEHGRVPLHLFMDDTIPEKVPVYDMSGLRPERS